MKPGPPYLYVDTYFTYTYLSSSQFSAVFQEVVIAEHDIAKNKIDWLRSIMWPGKKRIYVAILKSIATVCFNTMNIDYFNFQLIIYLLFNSSRIDIITLLYLLTKFCDWHSTY